MLFFRNKKGEDVKRMEGKNEKLEMMSLAWCESMKGLRRERKGKGFEAPRGDPL